MLTGMMNPLLTMPVIFYITVVVVLTGGFLFCAVLVLYDFMGWK